MADYIAKVQSIRGELKELGIVFPEQAPAVALLVGLISAYEEFQKMPLTSSAEDLTFAKVSSTYLFAEKDTTAQAKAYALRAPLPHASVASAPFQRNRFPRCTYVVKYGNCKGQVCGDTNHPLATCFKKKDDEWGEREHVRVRLLLIPTRPDLAYPVSVLSCYVAPGRFPDLHWKVAKRVLRYLQGTKSHVLTLGELSPPRLEGYTDSSWADDQTDRRSSQGYCFNLGSRYVSLRSTRSSGVSLSSYEAELYAGTMAAQEARWLTFLLQELGYPQPTPTLWCDNKSTIHLAQDPVYHTSTKHIELRHFFMSTGVVFGPVLAWAEPTSWSGVRELTWLICSPSPLGKFLTIVFLAPWGSTLHLLCLEFD
ncbi:unnamed protein product [Closterium sp. NIES-54]